MSTEPRVVSTQTTITSTEVKPQQSQPVQTDQKLIQADLRKEPTASEAPTLVSKWSPSAEGPLVSLLNLIPIKFPFKFH